MHAIEEGAYRQAQIASAEDIVPSVLLPNLTFTAARVFLVP